MKKKKNYIRCAGNSVGADLHGQRWGDCVRGASV